jgi:transcriptional regulator with XRE-family HTH domain
MNDVGRLEPPGKGTAMLTTGERIQVWRRRHELRQKELAQDVGISAKQLGRYEADISPVPSDILGRIAVRLGVSADYLLGLAETTPSDQPTGSILGQPERPTPERTLEVASA